MPYINLTSSPQTPTSGNDTARKDIGNYREYLLCRPCEQRFGRWEDYAKKTFVDGKGLKVFQFKEGVRLEGIDYSKFKLFLLSMLWRMGVSSLHLFAEVQLGKYHEEALRVALLNENPLDPTRYACFLMGLSIKGKIYTDWIFQPSLVKVKGQHCYRILINGILFCFFVSKQPVPSSFMPLLLNRQNQLFILQDDVVNVPFLSGALHSLSKTIKRQKAHS